MIASWALWLLLAAGLVSIAGGVQGAYGWKKPWDGIGALWALLGLAGAVVAVLLLHVPDFF